MSTVSEPTTTSTNPAVAATSFKGPKRKKGGVEKKDSPVWGLLAWGVRESQLHYEFFGPAQSLRQPQPAADAAEVVA